ncbi:MAG: beta-Ala-His dipeptidase [Candidatus Riflebacteria bacterium]|nr:beta-Ala-His dipeptidase [Candidatus Riflebacteria bacterium]
MTFSCNFEYASRQFGKPSMHCRLLISSSMIKFIRTSVFALFSILSTSVVMADSAAIALSAAPRSTVSPALSSSSADSPYDGLAAKAVWRKFLEISLIPRESKHEKELADHICERACGADLQFNRDRAGNVVVFLPATPGHEKSPTVVLQAHLDMVCVKAAGSKHDFARDPIEIVFESGRVRAKDTTLGADDGIGVSTLLAILDGAISEHGSLELLFTVDEEGDYTGVSALTPVFFKGRILINLDAEEAHLADIGCAGGQADTFTFPLRKIAVEMPCRSYNLRIGGLRGGHSGVDIHRGRGNAIRLLGRLLRALSESFGARVVSVNGGTVDTAIPAAAEALIFVPGIPDVEIKRLVDIYRRSFARELASSDPDITIDLRRNLSDMAHERYAASSEDTRRLVGFLTALPQGVLRMSAVFPGTVEQSTNPGILRTSTDSVTLISHLQSLYPEAKTRLSARMARLAGIYGFSANAGDPYPSWEPSPSSPLLKLAASVHKDLFGVSLATRVVHAGLECGVLAGSIPGIDMIALGPTIRNAHSPSEYVDVASVEYLWTFLKALLRRIS